MATTYQIGSYGAGGEWMTVAGFDVAEVTFDNHRDALDALDAIAVDRADGEVSADDIRDSLTIRAWIEADDVTDEQINALRYEADVAGDIAMATIANRALGGHADARAECARVIREAAAQDDGA